MTKHTLLNLLSEYKKEDVERYISYIEKLSRDEKSSFINKYSDEWLAELFRRVENEWLHFDGVHITLQSTGISYDYQALKNKMLLAYPESIIDVSLVYEWDDYDFKKKDWVIIYHHNYSDPFKNTEDKIIWGYVVIKNKRWEFFTPLSKADFDKHKKTAKTQFIWNSWYSEMCMKTVMKKACKTHFWDVYEKIEEMDNENYDPNRVNKWQDEIDAITTYEELKLYFAKNKWQWVEFDKAIANKKNLLLNSEKNDNPQS